MTQHSMLTRSQLANLPESEKIAVMELLQLKYYHNEYIKSRTKTKKGKSINTNMEAFCRFETENQNKINFIMAFDTETTGLFPKTNQEYSSILDYPAEILNAYPYITQLSFILFDYGTEKIVYSFNSYIRIPQDVKISDKITELTGVTREKCDAGMLMEDALEIFYKASTYCNTIVAHNIWFDKNMILVECNRNKENFKNYDYMRKMFNYYDNPIRVRCSMKSGFQYLNLKKWPRLAQLHELLFNETVESYNIPLHNALVDTLVCLRCAVKIFDDINVSSQDFTESIESLIPRGITSM